MTSVEKLKRFAEQTMASVTNSKGKYFASSRKGENYELKAELNSSSSTTKKDAVKRVIANMTIGKDVSPLFADVLKCMQTDDLELKKLVYLYLMNYAKTQPELVILAVNTFCKDTEDRNPLIRALAIRTMGCIRVERILDYLCEPLRKALHDLNPYVRKTAAIAVAKLYDLSPTLAEENGFISRLQDLIADGNPSVVANAVAALSEINDKSPERNLFTVNSTNLSKLLSSLSESTEWGQITILDAVALYKPLNEYEAEMVIDKTLPRLQHANNAIVLSAIKVLVIYLEKIISNRDLVVQATKKMIPPLVSLFSSPPEIQYIALRNIRLILQRYPDLLTSELRIFFCKYNDPLYVKLEKLEVMVVLANDRNVDQILSELKEYSKEIDVEFVGKSAKAAAKVAVRVPSALSKCCNLLMEFLNSKIEHNLQEAIIAIRDLLRKFGHQIEINIPSLFSSSILDMALTFENEPKSALIWILGEYCHLLENSPNLLNVFIQSFIEEAPTVQLQILTAGVKLYLRMPGFAHDAVHQLLQKTTKNCENADVRDRAFIYWRLLSCDPKFTKSVILSPKESITSLNGNFDQVVLGKLLHELSSLSSLYHLTPEDMPTLSNTSSFGGLATTDANRLSGNIFSPNDKMDNILDLDLDSSVSVGSSVLTKASSVTSTGPIVDLLGDDLNELDIHGGQEGLYEDHSAVHSPSSLVDGTDYNQMDLLLPELNGKGLEIYGKLVKNEDHLYLDLLFVNHSNAPLQDIAVQLNKNSFGLVPSQVLSIQQPIQPSHRTRDLLALGTNGPIQLMSPIHLLQMAVKTQTDIFYFDMNLPIVDLLLPTCDVFGHLSVDQMLFDKLWQLSEGSSFEMLNDTIEASIPKDRLVPVLQERGCLFVYRQGQTTRWALNIGNQFFLLAQLTLPSLGNIYKISIGLVQVSDTVKQSVSLTPELSKSLSLDLVKASLQSIQTLLQ